jgi:hypothetical protein
MPIEPEMMDEADEPDLLKDIDIMKYFKLITTDMLNKGIL